MERDSAVAGALTIAFIGLLLSAGIEDVRRREIADGKTVALCLLAPVWWWVNGLDPWPGMAVQVALAAAAFAVFAGAFALGAMGGGDVKLIAALALWFPPLPFLRLLVLMSLAGGAVTLLLLLERRRAAGGIEVPYGVAIAAAGLLTVAPTHP